MQRLIDADKTMKMIEEAKVSDEKSRNFAENIIRFSKTVLEIPDKPTNGDMIKAMFPQAKIYQSGGYTNCNFKGGTFLEDKTSDWWNAPYKRGDTDEY